MAALYVKTDHHICLFFLHYADFILFLFFADHNRTLKQLQLYVHGPPPGVEFITDSVHMSLISLDKNWRTKAQDRIDTARKNSLTVNVKAFSQDFQNLTIEVMLNYGVDWISATVIIT